MTSVPNNEAELQLYRVLQRASLLIYFDTLLEMGGDDVRQLCEAGEEEFLEIMALVGMANKPLHVRRLQKSLHEWMTDPNAFRASLSNIDSPSASFSPESSTVNTRVNTVSFIGSHSSNTNPSSTTQVTSLCSLASNLQQISSYVAPAKQGLSDEQIIKIKLAAER